MKMRASVHKFCDKCRIIHRGKRLTVICYNLRHKQRQG